MTGQFLRNFTDKITISVRLSSDQKVTVNKDTEEYVYSSFQMFFNDLRAYYINRISTAPEVDKKAICYDAIQSFYLYQEDFGIYCDRAKLTTECEY